MIALKILEHVRKAAILPGKRNATGVQPSYFPHRDTIASSQAGCSSKLQVGHHMVVTRRFLSDKNLELLPALELAIWPVGTIEQTTGQAWCTIKIDKGLSFQGKKGCC